MSRLRSDVDNVVCLGHKIQMVLHDNHRVSLVNQTVKNTLEKFDIGRMQSDRWLLQDIESSSFGGGPCPIGVTTPCKLGNQFNALCLTAAEGWAGLTES